MLCRLTEQDLAKIDGTWGQGDSRTIHRRLELEDIASARVGTQNGIIEIGAGNH